MAWLTTPSCRIPTATTTVAPEAEPRRVKTCAALVDPEVFIFGASAEDSRRPLQRRADRFAAVGSGENPGVDRPAAALLEVP